MSEPMDELPTISEHAHRNRVQLRGIPRFGAVLLWASFVGASFALTVMLLMPEGWLDAPLSHERLALAFLIAWLLALVPSLIVAVLLARPGDFDGY